MIGGLTRFEPAGPGRFRGAIDGSWNQGPGTFGGLLAGVVGQSLETTLPGRTVRALSIHICAPATPGPLEVVVQEERRGALVSFASARIERDGRPVVIATATLGAGRSGDADFERATPVDLRDRAACAEFEDAPGIPVFVQHFRMLFDRGVPFTGRDEAVSQGWIATRVPERLTTPVALALLDAWPLAILPTFPQPRAAASVAIHYQLFPPLAEQVGGWYRCRVRSDLTRQGYSDQRNEIWDAAGRLVGRATQLVAVIR